MTTCKALVTRVTNDKARFELEDVAIPTPADNQALVRVETVAQNPTDYQALINNAFGEDHILGCDFVGVVEDVGSKVTRVEKGDKIAGLIWGGEYKMLGAYSQYTLADEKICFKVPKGTSAPDAATVPLAAGTAWLALFSKTCLDIDRKSKKPTPVLVWGGSSSVGQYTIQLAHKYGIPVVAVCSPANFDLCTRLGASHCFDYHDEEVVSNIRSAAPDLIHVFDCIGAGKSSETSSSCIGESKRDGVMCTVRPGKALTEGVDKRVKVTDVLVWTAFLREHQYKSFHWAASQDDHDLASELYGAIPGWLEDGSLVTNKSKVLDGGLNAVNKGFDLHKEGKISGFKLVYKP